MVTVTSWQLHCAWHRAWHATSLDKHRCARRGHVSPQESGEDFCLFSCLFHWAQPSWEGHSPSGPHPAGPAHAFPESGSKCKTAGYNPSPGARWSGCPGTYPQPEGGCLSGSKGNKRWNTSAIGSRKKSKIAQQKVMRYPSFGPSPLQLLKQEGFLMPFNSFAFALPLFYDIRGWQEDLSGFLKTLINHFHQGIKVLGGKGKRNFSEIMHSVCRVMGKWFCRCIGPIKLSEEFGPNVFCAGEMSSSFILQLSWNLSCRQSLRRVPKAAGTLCVIRACDPPQDTCTF